MVVALALEVARDDFHLGVGAVADPEVERKVSIEDSEHRLDGGEGCMVFGSAPLVRILG